MSTSSSPTTSALQTTPIPTPTYGTSGSFTILAKTFIPHAKPAEVLSAIRDTNTWSQWNGFTPSFTFSSSSTISGPDPDSTQLPNQPPPAATPIESDPAGPVTTTKPGWLNLHSEGTMAVFMNGNGLIKGSKKSRDQGMIITILEPLTAPFNPPHPSQEEVEKTGYRIAWKSLGYAHWQLYSERVTELVEVIVDDEEGEGEGQGEGRRVGGTEYFCWETFGGVLAPVVKLAVGGTLRERFGEYADGLRGFCGEGRKGDGSEAAGN